MIKLNNVSKYYNNNGVVSLGLHHINLDLHRNEIVAIVGDSGSGKSTLLNVICGVDTYDEGEMFFNGEETSYFNQNDLDNYRKTNVGFIYQNYNIIDSYTVLENVMLPMLINGKSVKDSKERAIQLIEKVGLKDRINHKGTKLSGGEKQRCVIARALASDCEILACDEPTGNLDSKTGAEIIKLIKEVSKDKLVLIVTHNYDEVKDIISRRIKISDGEVVEDYVIKEVENEVLEKQEKVKEKHNFIPIVALKNIKSTPRKTFFAFFVFLCLSLIAFYLYLSSMQSSEVSSYNPDRYFQIHDVKRLVAFNFDHSKISKEKLDNLGVERYDNAFYEDYVYKTDIIKNGGRKEISLVYTKRKLEYNHIYGRELDKDEEGRIYLLFPKLDLDKYSLEYSKSIGGTVRLSSSFHPEFVGYGVCDVISTPVVVSNTDLSKIFMSKLNQELSIKIDVPRVEKTWDCKIIYRDVPKPVLFLAPELEKYSKELVISMYLRDMYPTLVPEFEINYVGYASENCYFSLPMNMSVEFDGIYESSIYASNPADTTNKLERGGLTVIRPSVGFESVSLNRLLFFGYVVISTLVVFLLSFVSYVIISRIYISKNKDYTVLRSLGVLSKQMNKIVILEMLILAIIASVASFILIYATYYIFKFSFLNIVTYNRFSISLLYYVVMILFTLFIARKFNKRLFKLSVQTSLKGDAARND